MPPTALTRNATILGLAGAALFVSACTSQLGSSDHGMSAMAQSGNPGHMSSDMPSITGNDTSVVGGGQIGDRGDAMFVMMMIPHHQQAVEMADLALSNSSASAFVRDLASRIKAGQQPEIDLMSSWLDQWGIAAGPAGSEQGIDHSGHDMGDMSGMAMGDAGMPGMMTQEQMEELQSAKGADFNRLWLIMMIEHHEGALDMVQSVLQSTANDEVRSLAQAMATAQRAEIKQMQVELSR